MRRFISLLTILVIIALSAPVMAVNLSGTYTTHAQGNTITLVLRQDAQGNLGGTLSSSTGMQFQIEGMIQDGVGVGACYDNQGGVFFEAHPQGNQLLFALIEVGQNNMPDRNKTTQIMMTKQSGGAPGMPQQPGMQQPGMQQPGMAYPGQQPGMQQPGMAYPGGGMPQQPGMQQPGMQQPGMQQPGMAYPGGGMPQQPGIQQQNPSMPPGMSTPPGMQQPGMQQPGMAYPGGGMPQQPGMQQPGMPQQPGMQQPGVASTGPTAALRGKFCSREIWAVFDGQGSFQYGEMASGALAGAGRYMIQGNMIMLSYPDGSADAAAIAGRAGDGSITALQYEGQMFAPNQCR